jgi:hypothetical protein
MFITEFMFAREKLHLHRSIERLQQDLSEFQAIYHDLRREVSEFRVAEDAKSHQQHQINNHQHQHGQKLLAQQHHSVDSIVGPVPPLPMTGGGGGLGLHSGGAGGDRNRNPRKRSQGNGVAYLQESQQQQQQSKTRSDNVQRAGAAETPPTYLFSSHFDPHQRPTPEGVLTTVSQSQNKDNKKELRSPIYANAGISLVDKSEPSSGMGFRESEIGPLPVLQIKEDTPAPAPPVPICQPIPSSTQVQQGFQDYENLNELLNQLAGGTILPEAEAEFEKSFSSLISEHDEISGVARKRASIRDETKRSQNEDIETKLIAKDFITETDSVYVSEPEQNSPMVLALASESSPESSIVNNKTEQKQEECSRIDESKEVPALEPQNLSEESMQILDKNNLEIDSIVDTSLVPSNLELEADTSSCASTVSTIVKASGSPITGPSKTPPSASPVDGEEKQPTEPLVGKDNSPLQSPATEPSTLKEIRSERESTNLATGANKEGSGIEEICSDEGVTAAGLEKTEKNQDSINLAESKTNDAGDKSDLKTVSAAAANCSTIEKNESQQTNVEIIDIVSKSIEALQEQNSPSEMTVQKEEGNDDESFIHTDL